MGGSIRPAWNEPGFDADRLFRLAAESLPGGVLVVAADGTIVFVNAEVERLSGYTRQELIGQPVEILLPDARPEPGRMGARRELSGRRRDGSEFPVEIGLNPIETPHGTFVLATMVDAAARKQVDRANSVTVEDQLEFERLVAELSAKFINLPADQVIDTIRDALRRIGEGLDLDRCNFYRIQPDGMMVDPISWVREGFPPAPAPVAAEKQFPWALETVRAGQVVCFSSVEEIPNPVDRENYRSHGIRSAVTVPLSVAGEIIGAVGFNRLREQSPWAPETVHRLRVISSAFGNVLARQKADESLAKALAEVERLRDQLHAENVYLRREAQERLGTGAIVGNSPAVRRVLEQVQQVAATDSTVLLLGETGTGKELFATQIHEASARRARTMVRVNCAAIPETLMESELFGREKGAFTGALARQAGRFEVADHSTIFLDEIGDLPADVQVKLLRVLEERQIERLGSPKPIHVDVTGHRRHAPGPGAADRGGDVSRGFVLPAQRLSHSSAAAAGTGRGHSAAGVAVRRGVLAHVRQADRGDPPRGDGGAAAACVAGQHPRAAQRRGARDDRGDRAPADDRPPRDEDASGQAQPQAGRRRGTAHPERAREHALAHPGGGGRGGAARAPAHHARNAHGQAGDQPAEGPIAPASATCPKVP